MSAQAIGQIIGLIIYALVIIDIATPSGDAYKAANANKALWVVMAVLFGIITWLIFAFTKRSRVKAAATA